MAETAEKRLDAPQSSARDRLGPSRQGLGFPTSRSADTPLRSGGRDGSHGSRRSRSASSFPRRTGGSSRADERAPPLRRIDRRFTLIAEIDPTAEQPSNDGVVDPSGRLWFGTMDNGETAKTGASTASTRDRRPDGIEG